MAEYSKLDFKSLAFCKQARTGQKFYNKGVYLYQCAFTCDVVNGKVVAEITNYSYLKKACSCFKRASGDFYSAFNKAKESSVVEISKKYKNNAEFSVVMARLSFYFLNRDKPIDLFENNAKIK